MLTAFIVLIFATTMITAAMRDAFTMTIPNWASLAILTGFFLVLPFIWTGWAEFGVHLACGLGMFAVGFGMFAFGWLGGGDAKLMAATSFWWVGADLFVYVVMTTLAGGVLAIGITLFKNFAPPRLALSPRIPAQIMEESKVPYGLALASGALITLPQSRVFEIATSAPY